MHKFSEFASTVHFVGDKISINKILNKEISVLHYRIEPSKHGTDDYAQMQIELDGEKMVCFTTSMVIKEQLEMYKDKLPFTTTIIKPRKYFTFTYTIMMGIAIGGSASSNKSTAAEGEQVIFIASPDVGSEFLNWEILKDGESTPTISIDNPLTYTMPACNIGVTPVFNEGSPPVPSDPITLVFKVTGTDGPPSGYTVRFTYPSGSLIFQGTTSPLGTVRMNTDNYPIYAEDGMIATATNGSNTGTIIINASDVTDDKANPSGEILFEIPVNVPTGVINVPAEGETFTFTVPQNITVLEAITASQGTTVKDYIGVTAGKTYTWSVALTYTPPQPVVRGLWQLKNGSDSVLVQIVKYIGSNLVGSGASVLSYSEAINKISPTITAY